MPFCAGAVKRNGDSCQVDNLPPDVIILGSALIILGRDMSGGSNFQGIAGLV